MFIHKAFTHSELALEYNTPDKLKSNDLVEQFVSFIEERVIGHRVKGKQVIIDGGMIHIKNFPMRGHSPASSLELSLGQMRALATVDGFFRSKNWNR